MKPVELPPPLPGSAASRALRPLGILLGLLLFAWLVVRHQLPLPPCPLRALTNVPCPLCGGTRTFAALAQLDFAGAVRLNPLVSVAAALLAARWLLTLLRRDELVDRLSQRFLAGARWKWLLGLALAANWLYLVRHLPR